MERLFAICRKRSRILLGLMSGTSHDGVDAAIVRIAGSGPESRIGLLHSDHFPYPSTLKGRIAATFEGRSPDICRMNFELGDVFARAAIACAGKAGMKISEIDAIASHGQTICHIPPEFNRRGSTLQIGESAVIARKTGVPVVSDFRTADMAMNGQGAPLVPCADYVLFHKNGRTRAAQNIGGIANVTVVTPDVDDVIAFDTGPGNCLIDDAMARFFRKSYDRNGSTARKGTVDEALLRELLSHPYFSKRPPKSTGRELFGKEFLDGITSKKRLRPEDVIATLTHLTAFSIKSAYDRFIFGTYKIDEIIISGGGSKNAYLVSLLEELFKPVKIRRSDAYGIPSTAKEALSFAILANETLSGRPSNLPRVTGAEGRTILGKITLP